ncbi:MAG: MucBP domain-containing protein, partial [Clostridia bacterium]
MRDIKLSRVIKSVIFSVIIVTLVTSLNLVLASTSNDDYKKTSDLTGDDINDDYQKNYQEITKSDGSYIIKSAEWVDKESGEALITIKASQVAKEKTTCLYVATMCYAHGLNEDVLVENLVTLTKAYDNVDFIAINKTYEAGIVATKKFTSESTESEIRAYVQQTKSSGEEYPHYICSIPAAIQKYLFGNIGDSYISEDNLVNKPIAIYVSCDSMYLHETSSAESWGIDYATEKYFDFMKTNYKDRYFSMSQSSQQQDNPTIIIRYPGASTYNANMMNLIIGVLNLENYGEADSVLSQANLDIWKTNTSADTAITLPYSNKKYAAQYSYDKNFEEAGVKIISNCSILDTVVDEYEIIGVEAKNSSGTSLPVNITNQKITIVDSSYASGEEIVVKISVKLRPDVVENYNDFMNTNVGSASLSSDLNDEILSVESPKLIPITSSYTVNYIDKHTNQIIKESKIENDIAINTQINASDEVINISGYTHSYSDIGTLTVNKDGNNVINLYYSKNTSLTVNYIDKAINIILDTYTEEGYEGKSYTTSSKDFERYTLVEVPQNQNGEMEYDGTVVNYYYLYNSDLTIKYIDEISGEEISSSISTTLKEGDKYTTTPKEIEKYKLVKTPENANGTMERENIEVIYYYKKISAGVETRYVDQVTGLEVSTSTSQNGLENDEYTTTPKEIIGYELVYTPNNANGKMTVEKITVTYEYRKNSDVTVRYINENTGSEITSSVTTTYKEGDPYTTEKKTIEGYTYTRD